MSFMAVVCWCSDVLQGTEDFIGFVTARTFKLDECSISDRACMGLESRSAARLIASALPKYPCMHTARTKSTSRSCALDCLTS